MMVHTTRGRIEGTTDHGVNVFRGIPFALPPLGDLRWREPQDVPEWRHIRQAVDFGLSCVQPVFPPIDGTEPIGDMSEDCLYLNVWTPQTEAGRMLARPVMVWIHGGAFKIGDGISSMYNGAPLAKKGAVVVTLNYRLGHLGFFGHPALEKEYPTGPLNFGLLDQIAALEWVRDNISRFGGDPGNVTIFGQSAGAMSVLSLCCSQLAAGLFHKAVAQSPYAIPEFSRPKAVALGAAVANKAWQLGPKPTLAELRLVPEAAFKMILTPIGNTKEAQVPVPSLAPVAVWGDPVLPKKIRTMFEEGGQHPVPLIIGSTSDEQSVLAAFGMSAAAILDELEKNLPPLTIAKWKGWYRQDPEINPPELENRERLGGLILRDILFTMQARWLASHQAKKASPTHPDEKISAYRYYFSYVPEYLRDPPPHGVPHGGELVFPFDTGDIAVPTEGKFTARDRAMAERVSHYWFQFAATGTPSEPGTAGLPVAWPKHVSVKLDSPSEDQILKLGEPIQSEQQFRVTRLNEFAAIYPFLEAAIENMRG
jgi:para-nitrobenzyl esterase